MNDERRGFKMDGNGFEGARCIVTGGCGGLGEALCLKLSESGCKVVALDVSPWTKKDVCNEIEFIKCDVTRKSEFQKAFERAEEMLGGKIHVLVNNAGIANELKMELTFEVNTYGVLYGTELFIQRGIDRGVVINVASAGGLFPMPWSPFYSASKSAVLGYSRSIADSIRVRNKNLLIHCICPSFVETQMIHQPDKEFQKAIQQIGILSVQYVTSCITSLIEDSLVQTCTRSKLIHIQPKRGQIDITSQRVPSKL